MPDETPVVAPPADKRSLMILLPQYKHTCPATLFSLLGLWDKTTMRVAMRYGDAFIPHTRNLLAQQFLASDCEWSLWFDDDMVAPIGNAAWFNGITGWNLPAVQAGANAVQQLLGHGKTLVGATYFGRTPKGKPMFYEGAVDPSLRSQIRKGKVSGLRATEWVGTGCLLVHRSVYEDIQKQFPHLAPRGKGLPWEFFSPTADSIIDITEGINSVNAEAKAALIREAALNYRMATGEDVIFSRRAKAAGHQPHVDLGLICGHVGHETYGPQNTSDS